jgi:hypothetical protein
MVATTFTDRPSLLPGWKLPLVDGFDGILVQPESDSPHDLRVVNEAVGSDHYPQHHSALQKRATRFIAVLRLRPLHRPS